MDSTSLGFRLFRSPSYGTPSTTYSGAELAEMELKPRIRMEGLLPGWPDDWTICTPATLPDRADVTLDTWDLASSSEWTTFAEPVKASYVEVPKATTMVSSSIWVSSWRTTWMDVRPFTGTVSS